MIIQNNEELLRKPCEDIKPNEIGELRELLERELKHSAELGRPGIGLALPQIGIYKKMAIVRINSEFQVDLVNAKLDQGFDLTMFRDEGCLSFPGRVENTMRYQEAYITNNLEQPNRFIATGLFAVCIQHELDHLNSILLPDRAIITTNAINTSKIDRNDLCFCGSNKKFKKCCGRNI